MRAFGTFLAAMVALIILLAMALIVLQNGQTVRLTVLNTTLSGPAGLGVAIAAGLGFLAAFLLLFPGRLASAWRRSALSRRSRALEANLGALREEHAQLRGSHALLLEEHQLVMNHMLNADADAGHEGQVVAPAAARGTVVVAERSALPLSLPALERPKYRSRYQPPLVARVRLWVAIQREQVEDAWLRLRLRWHPLRQKRDRRNDHRRDVTSAS